ncbi:hypothetical protein [Psychrilyobacter sp.]|uniref:hypothetical protein n=1 Tax=Psychrilyobacter sp. TaxID=2586924 RepID=UPI00301A2D69
MSKTFLNTTEVAEAVVQMAIKKTKTKSSKIFVLGRVCLIFCVNLQISVNYNYINLEIFL